MKAVINYNLRNAMTRADHDRTCRPKSNQCNQHTVMIDRLNRTDAWS